MQSSNTMSSNTGAQVHEESNDASAVDVEKLRDILLSSERSAISAIETDVAAVQQRQSNPETRAQDLSEVLAKATKLAAQNDEKYSAAIKPVVVEQFQVSSRENPEIMAEALFPILGPAIRKMIASMLSLDSTKKKRTYKFEQLFLIEKESGLPICHAKADSAQSQDADMVSGMLSAIQSFVQDAFATQEFDGLNTLQLGELSVWIEWGPSAVVAAVIRGVAPVKCREALQQLLEDIHSEYSAELKAYDGDSEPFGKIEPDFMLFMENHDSRLRNRVRNMSKQSRKSALIAGCLAMALLAWLFVNHRSETKLNEFISQLDQQPGIVVTNTEQLNGHHVISGLRDPLAVSPNVLLANSDLDAATIAFNLEPYQAMHPEFTLKRIAAVIVPSDGVTLELNGTELLIHGPVSDYWKEQATRLSRQFSQISTVTFHSAM